MEFLTRALFSPVKYTLLREVNNRKFATWPSFTENNITKFLSKYEAAALGHMDQAHKNACSTRKTAHVYAREEDVEVIPIEHQEIKLYICINGGHRYWKNQY